MNIIFAYSTQLLFAHLPTSEPKVKHRYDKNRGKLEFVLSGAGFLRLPGSQGGKRFYIIASLVPVLVFVLELFSIFLGGETRVCHTSRDSTVARAPSLRLFGEGEREVNAIKLRDEMSTTGQTEHPCLRRQSTYSGVGYLANMCADLKGTTVAFFLANTTFSENERIAIAAKKSGKGESDFVLTIFSIPSKTVLTNWALIGSVIISSDVIVNGRVSMNNDATNGYVMNRTTVEQIHNDVKQLEKASDAPPSEFIEGPGSFLFTWADTSDTTFKFGLRNVVFAIMSQTRRVGLETAAEMSDLNNHGFLPEVDILCEEDFILPRTVSIVIIVIGAGLRLLLIAVPTSISSAEYALLPSGKAREFSSSTEMAAEPQQIEV